ncbi:MAG TPA: hypothetical protein VHZ24_22170 [Pirellulales bacterium]|jgi:hypothetical protein|nr:hypothetical protein [Pirellulales bacterium]
MARQNRLLAAVAFSLVALSATTLPAQRPGQGRGGNPYANLKTTTLKGAIKQVQPAQGGTMITVLVTGNQEVAVMLMPTAKVTITGTAHPDGLTMGMNVEFKADLTKGAPTEPEVAELKAFDSGDPSFKSGVYSGEAGTSDAPVRTLAEGTNTYTVRGSLRSVKDGVALVAVPGMPPIKAKLGPDAKITVELKNPSAAQFGDGITVQGKEVKPGQVLGENVAINLNNPLSKKKPGAAPGKASPAGSPFGTP